MSEEKVEIVRRALTEFAETQQLSELVAPDFVWNLRSRAVWTGQGEFHGREGFMDFFADWIDAYEEWRHEFEEFVDAGGGQVVVTTVQHARLRGSDAWVDLLAGFVFTVEDGLMTRGRVFASRADALEAAGLSE